MGDVGVLMLDCDRSVMSAFDHFGCDVEVVYILNQRAGTDVLCNQFFREGNVFGSYFTEYFQSFVSISTDDAENSCNVNSFKSAGIRNSNTFNILNDVSTQKCESCGKRFTTYEKVETIPLSVIKKDQTREQYDRAKIQDGILRACYKRPIPIEKIEMTMDSIEGDIFDSADREIASTRIGEIVMEHLKDLDAVAYVRFASVYREFKDVSTFMDELKKFMEP